MALRYDIYFITNTLFGAKNIPANYTNHQAVNHSKYNQLIIENNQQLAIKTILQNYLILTKVQEAATNIYYNKKQG
jgi:hypothetical protein